MSSYPLICKHLGRTDFAHTVAAMQQFTQARHDQTPDEIWLTEHNPVYSLGLNRKQTSPPTRQDIPVIETDRGGKITYHGPGQLVVYVLLNLNRHHFTIRSLVSLLESTVIALLADCKVEAYSKKEAPGVYVMQAGIEAKMASLGLRVKNGCCYHGLSLNVDMDLSPFSAIDPCGYAGLKVTQTKDLGIALNQQTLGELLLKKLKDALIKEPLIKEPLEPPA